MGLVRGWALIIKWKIFETGDFWGDLGLSGLQFWLVGRNIIVPQK